jgi:molybdopterin converting factor small subunit
MIINVNLYAAAKHAAKLDSVSVEARTLNELRSQLVTDIPALAPIVPQCSFLIDGLSYGRDTDAPLTDGIRVDVMPPFSGG